MFLGKIRLIIHSPKQFGNMRTDIFLTRIPADIVRILTARVKSGRPDASGLDSLKTRNIMRIVKKGELPAKSQTCSGARKAVDMTENNPLSLEPSPGDENASTNEYEQSEPFNVPQTEEQIRELITQMFNEHNDRLLRMIEIRLQPELRARVEASDVLQEAFVEAFRQLSTGVSAPKVSSLVWLRLIVDQQLVALYRRYCQTKKRCVAKERSLTPQRSQMDPTSTSIFLASQHSSPSVAASRRELEEKLSKCLEKLDPKDREIISLRNFEQLTNRETAEELGIAPNVASVLHLRAIKRFKAILKEEGLDQYLD